MAVRAPLDPEPVRVRVRRDTPRDHLRLLPRRAEDMAVRAVLLLFALLVAAVWAIEHARTVEEDRVDVEDAKAALAEEGSISLAELKAELGL